MASPDIRQRAILPITSMQVAQLIDIACAPKSGYAMKTKTAYLRMDILLAAQFQQLSACIIET